jgi:glycosyltransferase involved in cell wall biosynthesis
MPTLAPARSVRAPSDPDGLRDRPLTVLLVHNVYQQPGGEDGVFEREGALLEERGHRVLRYELHNDAVEGMGRLALAARTVWSREAYAEVRRIVEAEGVDVVHVHNTLPLASPSVFHAAHAGGAATVHTLHNFRMVCPGNLLLRAGRICHDCVGKAFAAPAVRHKCYRGSAAATAAVATTVAVHRAAGTWDRAVDRYVALSQFARGVLAEGGLPLHRIAVKHNAPAGRPIAGPGGEHVLFAGRLATGKGLSVLLDAWALDPALPTLKVAGDGELACLVQAAAEADGRIEWLGWLAPDEMARTMATAGLLVAPSMWYEGWPLVAVEAMGFGTPVVATDHGAFSEMIEDNVTGRLFPRGDAAALAAAVRDLTGDPARLDAMREGTRARFAERYSRDVNYRQLRAIYDDAIAEFAAA